MASNNVIELTENNIDQEVKSSEPVIVAFWAAYDPSSRKLDPHLDALADQYKGKAKIAKVDIDKAASVPAKFGVVTVPTVLVFKGGQMVAQHKGACDKSQVEALLQQCLA